MKAAPVVAEVATDPLAARLRELKAARGQDGWPAAVLGLARELTMAETGAVLDGSNPPVPLAAEPAVAAGEACPDGWIAAAARAQVARGVWAGPAGTRWIFAVPIGHAGPLNSAASPATLVLEIATRQQMDLVLTRERLVALAAFVETVTQATAGALAVQGALATAAAEAMLSAPDRRKGLFAAASALAKGTPGVERLALVTMKRGRVNSLVLADQPQADPAAELPRLLGGLVEELFDSGETTHKPAGNNLTPAQKAYTTRFGTHWPVAQLSPGRRLGLAAAFRKDRPEETTDFAPALGLLERVLDPRPPRVDARSRRFWLISAAGLTAVILLLAVLPRPAVVEAPATLYPEWQQVVSAPYDGIVESSAVQPGDLVDANGTVLARLVTRELELEITAVRARFANDLRDATIARANGQPAQEQLALLSARRNEAQLALLEHRMAAAELRSPRSGVIVSGDLRRSLGQPVTRGQTLFEVAPTDATRAEIRVLDEDISRVLPGQIVRILPAAEPDRPRHGIVERIRPTAEVVQGRNAFVVVARLDKNDAPLHPGSEGVARIETGQTTWLAALLREPVRYVRRLLWV